MQGRFHLLLAIVAMLVCFLAGIAFAQDSKGAAPTHIYPSVIHFGTLNTLYGVNIDDARVALEINFGRQALEGSRRVKPTVNIIPDVATAAEKIRQKKLHGLNIASLDYIILRELVPIKPLYVASALSHSPIESYILLTRKEMDLDRLAEKSRRRLILEEGNQRGIGSIWLETALHERGLPAARIFFTSISTAAKPTRMVLPVFFGQADACLVPESVYQVMVELNPQLGKKLHTVLRSPGFIKSLVSVVDYLDPALVEEMKKSLKNMHLTADGRQLMMIFRHRRYFAFKPEYLADTEGVMRTYQQINSEFAKELQLGN